MSPPAHGPFTVSACSFSGGVRSETFTGDGALTRAGEFFELLSGNAGVAEVWLTWDDGPALVFVSRRRRRVPGERMAVIPAEPPPDARP